MVAAPWLERTMNYRRFADYVVVANLNPGLRAVELRMLRVPADEHMCVDGVVLADAAEFADDARAGRSSIPAAMWTWSSITANGPMETDASISAFPDTTAVG